MALYRQKGSRVWWYEFRFDGERIRESSKSTVKEVARRAMEAHRRQLEENYNSIKKPEQPKPFSVAAEDYLLLRRSELGPKTMQIHERSVKRLLRFIGNKPMSEVTHLDIKQIVDEHLAQGHSARYANMTIGTLRSILIRNGQWGHLRPFYRKLKERKDVGKELSHAEEERLLNECEKSPSPSLATKVKLGIYTGMRSDEIRPLRWHQINFDEAYLTVGKSKTEHGEGRIIPLIDPALGALKEWSARSPKRLPNHCVFPAEKYSLCKATNAFRTYNRDETKPMGTSRRAWETAKRRAGVQLRFHDLRHTTVTRLLDAGCTLEQIAPILGWSSSTMAEMMKRYQHRHLDQRRKTMLALVPPKNPAKSTKSAAKSTNHGPKRAAGD